MLLDDRNANALLIKFPYSYLKFFVEKCLQMALETYVATQVLFLPCLMKEKEDGKITFSEYVEAHII